MKKKIRMIDDNTCTFRIEKNIYPDKVIEESIDEWKDVCTIKKIEDDNDDGKKHTYQLVCVENDPETACLEFHNYLLEKIKDQEGNA